MQSNRIALILVVGLGLLALVHATPSGWLVGCLFVCLMGPVMSVSATDPECPLSLSLVCCSGSWKGIHAMVTQQWRRVGSCRCGTIGGCRWLRDHCRAHVGSTTTTARPRRS